MISMTKLRVRQKGQITLPIELRSRYKLEEGALLEVQERPEGVLLKPINPLEPGNVVGIEEYQKIIKKLEETRRKWR